jgi:hypothetical protein
MYAPYIFTQLGITGNTALSLFYTLSSSPLHAQQGSQSSLVVSWQRIYKSLTVTSNHVWSLLFTAQLLYWHYSAAANSEDSTQFNSDAPKLTSWQSDVSKLDSSLLDYSSTLPNTSLWPLCKDHAENTTSIVKEVCLLIPCLAKDVLLLSEFVCAGKYLPSRCPAMGIHVTICFDIKKTLNFAHRVNLYVHMYICESERQLFLNTVLIFIRRVWYDSALARLATSGSSYQPW